MRKNILATGIILTAVAILFGISYPEGLLFSLPLALLNTIIGLATKEPSGLEVQPQPTIRLLVDRGVVRASIYQLVFLDSKVILKRLSPASTTALLPLVLSVIGLGFLFIVGALIGGITGFSLQEYLTQRARNRIRNERALTSLMPGDIEVEYAEVSEVRLDKSRLYFVTQNHSFVSNIPKKYSDQMRPLLAKIFG